MPDQDPALAPSRLAVLARNARLVNDSARLPVRFVAIVQLLEGLLGGALLIAAGRVIDGLGGDDPGWDRTWPWIVVLAAVTTTTGVLRAVGVEQNRLITELVNLHTSQRLIRSAAVVPFERFDSDAFYDRLRRAHEGSLGSAAQIVWGTFGATRTLIDIVVIVGLLVTIVPVVLPVALLAYVPLFIASRQGNRMLHRFSWELTEDDRLRQYIGSLFTDRTASREVRMFDLGHWFGMRHSALWDERIARLRPIIRARLRISTLGSLVSSLVIAGSLGLVAWLASQGRLTLADAGIAILGVHRLSGAVTRLNSNTASLHQGGLNMRDYERFLHEAADATGTDNRLPPPTRVDRIDLVDVSFRYAGADVDALDAVTLSIHRGEVLALVGPNGSGKSTLMHLLCGLYTPTTGRVLWDGVDVADYSADQRRAVVAAMFQDFTRYQLSVRDNIVVSDFARTDDHPAIGDAIADAGAEPLVASLPSGLDTFLSRAYREGTELSAGQWQRLALARALFHSGPVLALDEPSADLDAIAERQLIETLRRRATDQCVLLISHRFPAVRRADRIAVLDAGRLIEYGDHETLMASDDGLYRAMYETQVGDQTGTADVTDSGVGDDFGRR